MVEWFVTNELERICKEAAAALWRFFLSIWQAMKKPRGRKLENSNLQNARKFILIGT